MPDVPALGRVAGPLAAFVEWLLAARLDYHALYPSTVVTQNLDGTLALLPDSDRVRGFGLDSVRIRTGIPGVVATVAAGSRVLLGFDAADPTAPYAALWEATGLAALTITATGTVAVNAPTINMAAAAGPVLRSGEIVNIAGVQAGAGVVAVSITANPATFPADGGISDVSA